MGITHTDVDWLRSNLPDDDTIIVNEEGRLVAVDQGWLMPSDRLELANETNPDDSTLLLDEMATSYWQKTVAAGSVVMQIDPLPSDGTGEASIVLFRDTDTTGDKSLLLKRGNGSGLTDVQLGVDGLVSFINGGGGLVIGGTSLSADDEFEVAGKAKLESRYSEVINQGNVSGTVTLDCDGADIHRIRLIGNATLETSNFEVGQRIDLEIQQDGTAGRTVTWNMGATVIWLPSNTAPTLSSTPNKRDLLRFTRTAPALIYGEHIGTQT